MLNHIKRTITRLGAALLIALITLPATSAPIDPLPEPSFTPSKPKPKPKPKQDRKQEPKPKRKQDRKQEPKPKRKQDRKQKAERMSKQDPNPNPGSRKLDMGRRPEDKAESPRSRLKDEPDKKPGHESSKYYGHTDYRHLDLITRYKKDGPYRYFTVNEWTAVPKNFKIEYNKLGIVVKGDSCDAFYIALHDSGREMSWEQARSSYGDRLPTERQVFTLAGEYKHVNDRIVAFGGDKNPNHCYWGAVYWGRRKPLKYMLNMGRGCAVFIGSAPRTYRVRAVSPVPEVSTK